MSEETLKDLMQRDLTLDVLKFASNDGFLPTVMPKLLKMSKMPFELLYEIQLKLPQYEQLILNITLQLIIQNFDNEAQIAFANNCTKFVGHELFDSLVDRILLENTNVVFLLLKNLIIYYYKIDKQKTVNLIDVLLKRNGKLKFVTILELLKLEIYVDVLVKFLLNLDINNRLLNQIMLMLLKFIY